MVMFAHLVGTGESLLFVEIAVFTHDELFKRKQTRRSSAGIRLPGIDECNFHETQKVRCIGRAYTTSIGTLQLQDTGGGIRVEDADLVAFEGAVLGGLTSHWVQILPVGLHRDIEEGD